MLVDKKILAKTVFKEKDYPSFILERIKKNGYQKPETKAKFKKFWLSIERLIKQYSFRLKGQYNINQEELIQQAYLFVAELIDKYQPAFPCDYIYATVCNSKCPFWKKCQKQEFFGWQIYQLKPYLFKNIRLKMLDYSQRERKHQERFFDLDFSSDGSDNDNTTDIVLNGFSNKKSMTNQVERKLITEVLEEALAEILESAKGTKREVGYLFFKKFFTEKEIHQMLNKSQSTINTHISAIKKQVAKHKKVVTMLNSLKQSNITISDILDD